MAGKEEGDELKAGESLFESEPEGPTISLRFLRGNNYRVVAVNGFMASVTLDGEIYLSPWHQHNDLPGESTIELTPSGWQETARFSGMVREVDVALAFSPEVAANLIALLQRQLQKLSSVSEAPDANATDPEK